MSVTDEDVLAILVAAEGEELPTTEIALELGISDAGAWRRLDRLAEAGIVSRTSSVETMGDRWTLSEEARRRLDEED